MFVKKGKKKIQPKYITLFPYFQLFLLFSPAFHDVTRTNLQIEITAF